MKLVVCVKVNEGDVVVERMSKTVVKPSVSVKRNVVTVELVLMVVGVVTVVVCVTKVSPMVRVMLVLPVTVDTVVGVGDRTVTEPVKTVALVMVMRVGLVMVGEKAVTVVKMTVTTDDCVFVVVRVVVCVPVMVVTSSTLKTNGLRTVKMR